MKMKHFWKQLCFFDEILIDNFAGGGAVPPPFAEALVRANLPELCGKKVETMEELKETMIS